MVEGLGADARPRRRQSLDPGGRGCALSCFPQRNRRRRRRRCRYRDGKRGRRGDPVAGRTTRADVSKPPRRRDTPRRPCHWEPFGLSKYPGRSLVPRSVFSYHFFLSLIYLALVFHFVFSKMNAFVEFPMNFLILVRGFQAHLTGIGFQYDDWKDGEKEN